MAQFARFALTLMVGVLTRPNNSAPLTVALLSASLYSLSLGWLSFGPLPVNAASAAGVSGGINSIGSLAQARRTRSHKLATLSSATRCQHGRDVIQPSSSPPQAMLVNWSASAVAPASPMGRLSRFNCRSVPPYHQATRQTVLDSAGWR